MARNSIQFQPDLSCQHFSSSRTRKRSAKQISYR